MHGSGEAVPIIIRRTALVATLLAANGYLAGSYDNSVQPYQEEQTIFNQTEVSAGLGSHVLRLDALSISEQTELKKDEAARQHALDRASRSVVRVALTPVVEAPPAPTAVPTALPPKVVPKNTPPAPVVNGAGEYVPALKPGDLQVPTAAAFTLLVMTCEAKGIGWAANTGNSFSGGPQFTAASWANNGGKAFAPAAYQATPAQQIVVAKNLYANGGGWKNWPACSRKLKFRR
ncbi:MAG: hypothetical protein JWM81_580 [Candidatus Saccharibacteria bacterium]|nr:hypothetical protein [Candidatus Saccharibacteria bacterium]